MVAEKRERWSHLFRVFTWIGGVLRELLKGRTVSVDFQESVLELVAVLFRELESILVILTRQ